MTATEKWAALLDETAKKCGFQIEWNRSHVLITGTENMGFSEGEVIVECDSVAEAVAWLKGYQFRADHS